MVRISLGVYNTRKEIDSLVDMLGRISRNDYQGQTYQVPESGDYEPVGYQDPALSQLSVIGSRQ